MTVFVSSSNTKIPDLSPIESYFEFCCPNTKGVPAMLHPWSGQCAQGSDPLMFVNGPLHRMGQIIRKINDEQVDSISVYIALDWPRVAMLRAMTICQGSPAVKKVIHLP